MTSAPTPLEGSFASSAAQRAPAAADDSSGESGRETFIGAVCAAGLVIRLAGISVRFAGEAVAGSAGSLTEDPFPRAAAELAERLALLRAMRSGSSFTAFDERRRPVGVVSHRRAFPVAPAAAPYRYARSNGVAAGRTWADAARRARLELVERDRVLRSWFGQHAPTRVAFSSTASTALEEYYDVQAYRFGEPVGGVTVAGVFAFPRVRRPLVYGFGARESAGDALAVAFSELVQRLGFLWNESVPGERPEPAPNPEFHQEHYLFPAHHEAMRRWLLEGNRAFAARLTADSEPREPVYVDLSLPQGPIVVRALPRGHVPLVFGVGHPSFQNGPPAEIAVHPIV
jgi:hypothetical protein